MLTPTTTADSEIARRAFEQATAYDRADRDRLLSIAALMALSRGDLDGAEANLARVGAADGLFPRLARAAITDYARRASSGEPSEARQVLQDADPAELAGEPTLLNLVASLAVRRGDLVGALSQFELAAAADPPYPTGRLDLARGLLSRMMAGRPSLRTRMSAVPRRWLWSAWRTCAAGPGPVSERW